MMAIRIVLYGIVAFVVARRNRNKTGGATAGPLTALANRLLGQTGDAATGAPAAEAGAASPQTARRPADESEGDEFDYQCGTRVSPVPGRPSRPSSSKAARIRRRVMCKARCAGAATRPR